MLQHFWEILFNFLGTDEGFNIKLYDIFVYFANLTTKQHRIKFPIEYNIIGTV